jgi:hypothetical protein
MDSTVAGIGLRRTREQRPEAPGCRASGHAHASLGSGTESSAR